MYKPSWILINFFLRQFEVIFIYLSVNNHATHMHVHVYTASTYRVFMFKSRKVFGKSSEMLFCFMCSPFKEFRSLNALRSIVSIPQCCKYLCIHGWVHVEYVHAMITYSKYMYNVCVHLHM